MGMLRKVPDRLLPDICALSAEGKTAPFIVNWLKTEHKITVARNNIYKIVSEHKVERAEAAKAAYANSAAQYANQDLNIISDIITKFKAKIDACLIAEDYAQANKLSQTLLNYIKTRLELSGLNKEDSETAADEKLTEILMKRITQYK